MTKLTVAYIRKAIKDDPRFDQEIDLEEYGKAIVYVNSPWTWCAADGNRHVEGFLISDDNADGDPADTVGYWKERVKRIEKEQ